MNPLSEIDEELPFFFEGQDDSQESQEIDLRPFNTEETMFFQENPFRLQRIIISNNHQSNENSN